MSKPDLIRLYHMLDAAREAQAFVENRSRNDLDTDRQLTLALLKLIEIIGEAAANVTNDSREKYPRIPWPLIVGMRNRLVHAYFDIDLDRVWDTVTNDLPPLIIELEEIISSEGMK